MPNAGPRSITNEEPSSGRVQQRSGHRLTVLSGTDIVRIFPPELTELQRQVLSLLGVPASDYVNKT